MPYLHTIFVGALNLLQTHPYLIPFWGAVVGGEETILVISALAAGGLLSFPEVFALSYAGTIVSDGLWFICGTYSVNWLERRDSVRHKLEVISDFVRRITKGRYFIALLTAKFLYGTRIITIFYLAKERLSFLRFNAYNSVVTALWAVVICAIGWFAGKGISWIVQAFSNISIALSAAIIFIIILYGVRIWLNKILVEEEHQ